MMSKWKAEGPHQQPVARDGMSEADWTQAAILGARCVVPMTCETPLHAIDVLRHVADSELDDRRSVYVDVRSLRWLLRDAQTLNELIQRVHHS